MRLKTMRRIASALLAALLLLPCLPAARAATADEAQLVVSALGILTGDDTGDLRLDAGVTRAEFTKMLVCASSYRDSVGSSASSSPFQDVPYTHWAASYIKTAVTQKWVTGYLDGTYRPSQTITLEEGLSAMLGLLGYTASDLSGSYPSAQLTAASSLGLLKQVSASKGQQLTRRDCVRLFYNLQYAKAKGSNQTLFESLGYKLNTAGEIDYAQLLNDTLTGPVVAAASWLSQIPFDTAGASFYRNDTLCAASDIRAYDVLYYSQALKTVRAYSRKVSGTYQSAAPNRASPTSITVAGNTYELSTAAAALAVSSLGSFQPGDAVTLLLDRNGNAAGVVSASETESEVFGIVTQKGTREFTDAEGGAYTAPYVAVTATDGQVYEYQTSKTFSLGALVSASYQTGSPALNSLSTRSLSGKVSAAGRTLGSRSLADDLEILETLDGSCARVYLSRLDGVTLQSGDVRYYHENGKGEIDRLILGDVTGDLYSYGILLEQEETSTLSSGIRGSYTCLLEGKEQALQSTTAIFHQELGPCQFLLSGGSVESIKSLSKVSLTGIDGLTASTGAASYTLADRTAVYVKRDGSYYLSSLSAVSDTAKYTLTGYYDQAGSHGGRIRVIVAAEK